MSILDSDRFLNILSNKFQTHPHYVSKLQNVLKRTGAKIAGGGVLCAYTDFDMQDLDIYVNISEAIELKNVILDCGYNMLQYVTLAPAYDQSFFRKNHILARYRFIVNDEIHNGPPIDIMIIPDDVNVLQVITNFDLTFCEIWYDGQNVIANDVASVLNKKGVLRTEYVESLLVHLNPFIIKRMKKYRNRGFTITYMTTFGAQQITKKDKLSLLNEDNIEEWVVKLLYKYWLWVHNPRGYDSNVDDIFDFFCKYRLTTFTLKQLKFTMNKWYKGEGKLPDEHRNATEAIYGSLPLMDSLKDPWKTLVYDVLNSHEEEELKIRTLFGGSHPGLPSDHLQIAHKPGIDHTDWDSEDDVDWDDDEAAVLDLQERAQLEDASPHSPQAPFIQDMGNWPSDNLDEIVEIVVPEYIYPGDILRFSLGDGQILSVTIPENTFSGDTLQLYRGQTPPSSPSDQFLTGGATPDEIDDRFVTFRDRSAPSYDDPFEEDLTARVRNISDQDDEARVAAEEAEDEIDDRFVTFRDRSAPSYDDPFEEDLTARVRNISDQDDDAFHVNINNVTIRRDRDDWDDDLSVTSDWDAQDEEFAQSLLERDSSSDMELEDDETERLLEAQCSLRHEKEREEKRIYSPVNDEHVDVDLQNKIATCWDVIEGSDTKIDTWLNEDEGNFIYAREKGGLSCSSVSNIYKYIKKGEGESTYPDAQDLSKLFYPCTMADNDGINLFKIVDMSQVFFLDPTHRELVKIPQWMTTDEGEYFKVDKLPGSRIYLLVPLLNSDGTPKIVKHIVSSSALVSGIEAGGQRFQGGTHCDDVENRRVYEFKEISKNEVLRLMENRGLLNDGEELSGGNFNLSTEEHIELTLNGENGPINGPPFELVEKRQDIDLDSIPLNKNNVQVTEFLNADPRNIIFIYKDQLSENYKGFCSNLKTISNNLKDLKFLMVECNSSDASTIDETEWRKWYVRMNIPYEVCIPYKEVKLLKQLVIEDLERLTLDIPVHSNRIFILNNYRIMANVSDVNNIVIKQGLNLNLNLVGEPRCNKYRNVPTWDIIYTCKHE